jgi:hypothetical protein
MENRTVGIIATIATVLLCGCPGLAAACFGALSALASFVPDAEIDMFGSSDPKAALGYGIGFLCVGLIFVVIPIVVGIVTLRKKNAAASAETRPISDEPFPPVS